MVWTSKVLTAIPVLVLCLTSACAGANASTPGPVGVSGSFELQFADEFDGDSVDWSRWVDYSSAEADHGRANPSNGQLEWNQGENCSVDDGTVRLEARPDDIVSPSGQRYRWSSCLLSSAPSFEFQYGFMEVRAKMPAAAGFWPAAWTWQTASNQTWTETDVYEFYTHQPRVIHMSQHSQAQDGCSPTVDFDPAEDFHTYGADIHEDGTDFYIDGRLACSTAGTSTGPTNLMLSNFVDMRQPPEPGSVGVHEVDYVRTWSRDAG